MRTFLQRFESVREVLDVYPAPLGDVSEGRRGARSVAALNLADKDLEFLHCHLLELLPLNLLHHDVVFGLGLTLGFLVCFDLDVGIE